MARMDVANGLQPAWENMVRVLFRPFSLVKWLSLGFISFIAYGIGSNGGGGFNIPGNWSEGRQPSWPTSPWPWVAQYWPFLLLGFLVLVAIGLLISWIASVLHFVYVDDLVRNSGAIAEPFARLRPQGTSFFLWRLAFGILFSLLLLIVVGAPVIMAFVFHADGLKVLAIVWAVMIGIPLFILGLVIDLFVRDFVTTTMYARQVRVMEAWRIAWPLLKENAGQVAIYIAILIAVAIVMGVFSLFLVLVCLLVFGIPFGIIAAVVVLIGKAMGLTWSLPVIIVAASFGGLIGLGFIYFVQCAYQPAEVFRRSYALVVMGQADPSLVTLPQPDK